MENKNQIVLDTFQFRSACKKYDPSKVVSDEDFATIMEAARLSPSSFGFEPWKFLVLRNAEIKEKLWDLAWGAQNSFRGASHFVILLARKKIDLVYDAQYLDYIMRDVQKMPDDLMAPRKARVESFQRDDFALLEDDRAIFDWACKQTYIALGNMLTVAGFLRVDSCPIEGFHREKAEAVLAEAGVLDREHFGVSVMASFGYRADAPHRPKTRRTAEEVIQWV